jgi:hypothetical protein
LAVKRSGETIFRSIEEPVREGLSWKDRWKGPDGGLIACWEVGRELSRKDPEIAKRSQRGELPVLPWKGGVDKTTKKGFKYGTLFYLAEFQGLRGEDLDVDQSQEVELVCSRTEMRVIYTVDASKYADD